jgi:predicted PhzF superfamily epimerase YddE/YHI9
MHTQCLSWRSSEDAAEVRCWAINGDPISLCGHGLLCCGAAWARSERAVAQLVMNGLPVAFHAEDDLAWIGLPCIDCIACAVPYWVHEFFPVRPWRAATAGDDNGYLILEWPAGFDLESLPVPRSTLRLRTGRAVIATCIDVADPAIDVQLRYFAPQHGVPEDSATGSAMRVLATYWRNRDLADGLRAYQCSSFGGELRSRIRGEFTWVGGRVHYLGEGAMHAL